MREPLTRDVHEILALAAFGFTVEARTARRYRINGLLDLEPTNRHYKVLSTGQRGSYRQETALAAVTRLLTGIGHAPAPPIQEAVCSSHNSR